jgi:F-type H+-transporting ATPase subunit a
VNRMLDEVFEKVNRIIVFRFTVLGHTFDVSNSLLVTWIVMALLIVISLLVTRKLSVYKPGKAQILIEWLTEVVNNLCNGSAGKKHGPVFVPYIGTLLMFLSLANIITLVNFIPGVHLYPPTKDINVTAALALISIIVVIYSGFRYKGFVGWAKSLIDPMPVMAPFKIMEYATKPLSLCLRLFGNVFAAFLIMELLYGVAPYVAAPFSAYFDIFDGILQAFIFAYLTIIYIGEAVE